VSTLEFTVWSNPLRNREI